MWGGRGEAPSFVLWTVNPRTGGVSQEVRARVCARRVWRGTVEYAPAVGGTGLGYRESVVLLNSGKLVPCVSGTRAGSREPGSGGTGTLWLSRAGLSQAKLGCAVRSHAVLYQAVPCCTTGSSVSHSCQQFLAVPSCTVLVRASRLF